VNIVRHHDIILLISHGRIDNFNIMYQTWQ